MATVTTATTDAHLDGIPALQRRNHVNAVASQVQDRGGFVFVGYCLSMLVTYGVPRGHESLGYGLAAIGLCHGVFALFTMYLPPLFPTLLRTTGTGFCLCASTAYGRRARMKNSSTACGCPWDCRGRIFYLTQHFRGRRQDTREDQWKHQPVGVPMVL